MLIVVLTTVASSADAEVLAEKIVGAGLGACVQILPAMTSVYRWKGQLQKETEHLMIIKTVAMRYDDLERFVLEHHPYDVPEIIAVPAERVSQAYLDFVIGSAAAG